MREARFALLGITALIAATVAAPLSPAAADQTGRATYYGNAAPGGNCSFPTPPADHLTAAAGPADYAKAAGCGGYFDVTGAKGTVRVKVDNLCPECEAGHLDLSNEAFARIDDLSKGIAPITYRQVVDPPLTGGLSFRVKEGSSQWWLAILVDNHGNPLKSVEVSSGGSSWRALERTDYNYWLASSGAGTGPFQVRVTDVRGHVAVASGIALRPTEVQQTSVRLYGSGSTGSTTSGATTSGATTSGATTPASTGTAPPATSTKGTVQPRPTATTPTRTSAPTAGNRPTRFPSWWWSRPWPAWAFTGTSAR